ncbi:MAG: hemolysin family protein [Ardenticatenia bacterium]|nr:hemolysin family protein [Ardenticatenia bacterium]
MDLLDGDSSSTLYLAFGLGFLLLFTCASAAEAMIRSVRHYEVRKLIEARVAGSISLQRLLMVPEHRRAILMVVRLGGAVGTAYTAAVAELWAFSRPTTLVGLVFLLWAVDQVVFMLMAGRVPVTVVAKIAILVEGIGVLMTPLLSALAFLRHRCARASRQERRTSSALLSDEELRILASVVGEDDAGNLSPREREMIARIFDLHETTVREIMVPRLDIVALPVNTSLQQALDTIVEHRYSRIPVYEGTIDHIIGALYAKDMLIAMRAGSSDRSISAYRDTLIRPVLFVPETKKLDELLHELQRHGIHLAIVVDEYGGTAGMATIEDILEEIVGEIWDEYDRDLARDRKELSFVRVRPNEVLCSGRMDLDDLNRLLDLDLPTDRSDTLGGLIYSELGRVPHPGEEMTVDGAHVRVEEVSGQRITRVRVTRLSSRPPEDDMPQESDGRNDPRAHEVPSAGAEEPPSPASEKRAGSGVNP